MDLLSTSVTTFSARGETFVIIELAGEADASSSDALRAVLDAQAGDQPRTVILDLSALRFMDSTALHVVLRANRELDRRRCVLALAGPRGPVAKVLRLTGADQLIPVYESVRAATES